MTLRRAIIWLIEKFKPTRSLVHNLIYVYGGDIYDDIDWSLSITGLYSEKIEKILNELFKRGIIIRCHNGRLTTDTCPPETIDCEDIVSEAVSRFLVKMTLKDRIVYSTPRAKA